MNTQRKANGSGKLTHERKGRLEEIGFKWDVSEEKWGAMFSELLEYKLEHGHVNAPARGSTALGVWITHQRVAKKKGELSSDRENQLDEIGFEWNPAESSWERSFVELLAYKTEHGNTRVPIKWRTSLGLWCQTQRANRKKSKLTHEREKRLEEIGFDWDPFESTWEASFTELLEFKDKYGNVNVPRNWPTKLGKWVGTQRTLHKGGKLSTEREKRLEKIGFIWNINNKHNT